jgi:hypothetical protein
MDFVTNIDETGRSYLLPNRLMQRNKTLEEHTFMVRRHNVELTEYLKQIQWAEQSNVRFIMWGKFGCGKSVSLGQMHHFGLKSNYIVLNFNKMRTYYVNYREVKIKLLLIKKSIKY